MKLGILTFHRAENYGAVLQAYALCKYLNSFPEIQAEIIDYRSNIIDSRNPHSPLDFKMRQSGKQRVKGLINILNINKSNGYFRDFRKNYLPLSSSIEKNDLYRISMEYDAIICGSDQVWNPDVIKGDYSYFADFASGNCSLCSYAASVGDPSKISANINMYKSLLERFQFISVREYKSKIILENLLNRNVSYDLDPVFLIKKNEWTSIATLPFDHPYALVFKMGKSKKGQRIIEFAEKFSENNNLELLYLTDNEIWYENRTMRHFGVASVPEFLGLISHAQTVITNSFHATAFSIIFEREFFVDVDVLRSERIVDLLQTVDLGHRNIQNGYFEADARKIDWGYVNSLLDVRKRNSGIYLSTLIESIRC